VTRFLKLFERFDTTINDYFKSSFTCEEVSNRRFDKLRDCPEWIWERS